VCFGKQCSTFQKYRDAFTFMLHPADEGIPTLRKHPQILAPRHGLICKKKNFFAERLVVTSRGDLNLATTAVLYKGTKNFFLILQTQI
jgi:hypothetical protein